MFYFPTAEEKGNKQAYSFLMRVSFLFWPQTSNDASASGLTFQAALNWADPQVRSFQMGEERVEDVMLDGIRDGFLSFLLKYDILYCLGLFGGIVGRDFCFEAKWRIASSMSRHTGFTQVS